MLLSTLLAEVDPNDIIGNVVPPAGVAVYNDKVGENGIGLLLFISNLIKLGTIVAGIWVMFNFISAGYIYITSAGDSSAHKKVSDQLTMSVIGLVIIVASYTIAGLLGLIIFGDPGYILNPQICGPEGCN
jgi:hypothetical protein